MALYLYDDPGTVYDTATYDSIVLVAAVGQPLVELLLNGVWTDVTVFVRVQDGIQIVRGRQDEQSSPVPATCSLTFDNSDGRFTPTFTSGAYYPYVARNTQLRVSVLLDDLVTYSIRFHGEASEWPISFDPSTVNVTVAVTAAGPRRRLSRPSTPLVSVYDAAIAGQSAVLEYWPMEDGDAATQFSNVIVGGSPAPVTASIDLASDDTWVSSDPLPTYTGTSSSSFLVRPYTPSGTGQQVRFWAQVNCPTINQGWDLIVDTTGAHYFVFEFVPDSNLGAISMFNYATGALESTNGPFDIAFWAQNGCRFSVELKQNGTGIDFNVKGYTPGDSTGFTFGTVTAAASTLGRISGVRAANNGVDVTTVFGQLTVENHITSQFDLGGATMISGYNGESAYARADRVATSNGVAHTMVGTAGDTELMGVQEKDTTLNLFDEAAFVDGGISEESVTSFELVWRTRATLLAQTPSPSLAITRLMDLQQTTDDQRTQNDVTVTRINGASSRRVATSGLTPALVGTYAAGYDLSLSLDSRTGPQAEWRLSQGSLDIPRFPVVAFDAVTGLTSGLRTDLVGLRVGYTMQVTALGGTALGIQSPMVMRALGWSETFLPGQWLWEINAVPGSPYSDAFILDSSSFGRLDTNRLGL